MKILFVCRGNVGRSQIAEALFNNFSKNHSATSVGTKVVDKEGKSVEGEMLKDREGAKHIIAVMDEVGIDVRFAARKQVTKDSVDDSDIVVVMAEKETLPDYLLESDKVRYWEIGDPKNQTLEEVRATRDTVDGLVKELLTEVE